MAKCKECGEPIEWVTTQYGARMPLNPDPDPAGNIILVKTGDGDEVAHQLRRGEDPQAVERFMPHFATCGRQACACVESDTAEDDALAPDVRALGAYVASESSPAPNELVLALDRLTQVLDHHLARVFNQLQNIADRLVDAP